MSETIKLTTIEEDLRLELERLSRLYPELCPTDQVRKTVDNIAVALGRGVDGVEGIVGVIIGLIQNAMRKRSSDQEVILNLFVIVSAIYLASKNDEQAKNKGLVILAS